MGRGRFYNCFGFFEKIFPVKTGLWVLLFIINLFTPTVATHVVVDTVIVAAAAVCAVWRCRPDFTGARQRGGADRQSDPPPAAAVVAAACRILSVRQTAESPVRTLWTSCVEYSNLVLSVRLSRSLAIKYYYRLALNTVILYYIYIFRRVPIINSFGFTREKTPHDVLFERFRNGWPAVVMADETSSRTGGEQTTTTRQFCVFCRQHGWMVRADEAHTAAAASQESAVLIRRRGWVGGEWWRPMVCSLAAAAVVVRGDLCECNAARARTNSLAFSARIHTQTAWHWFLYQQAPPRLLHTTRKTYNEYNAAAVILHHSHAYGPCGIQFLSVFQYFLWLSIFHRFFFLYYLYLYYCRTFSITANNNFKTWRNNLLYIAHFVHGIPWFVRALGEIIIVSDTVIYPDDGGGRRTTHIPSITIKKTNMAHGAQDEPVGKVEEKRPKAPVGSRRIFPPQFKLQVKTHNIIILLYLYFTPSLSHTFPYFTTMLTRILSFANFAHVIGYNII